MTPADLNPADLDLRPWPPQPTRGMLTGTIPRGIRAEHRPTGLVVIATADRSQHRNKEQALRDLALMVAHRSAVPHE